MKRSAGILLCCVVTLLALGMVMVFSVISAQASTMSVGVRFLVRHLMWIGIGLFGLVMAWRTDYRKLEKRWMIIAGVALVLLVLVLIPGIGTEKNMARRWIRLGPIGIQPSECAKLAVLVAVSAIVARRRGDVRNLRRGVLPPMAVAGVAAILIVLQPDFGTAVIVGTLGALVVLAAGAPLWPIAMAGVAGGVGVTELVLRSPAKLERLLAFLDPWKYLDGAGYQVVHSLISLGSGGVTGRGLGASKQKLFFLPESSTDFILAIIGEELGLVGTLMVIVILAILIRQGMRISEQAPDAFGSLLAFGITMMITLQGVMHIAVVSASMPTKGIGLPFMSAGGSSLLVCMTGVGILMSIARHSYAVASDELLATEPTSVDLREGMAAAQ